MKKLTLALVFAFVFVTGVFAELKIGYVNSDAILEQYSGTKSAEEELRKQYAKWEQEANKKEENIRKMQENLNKQALLLSEERKAQIQKEMQDSMMLYQQFLQDKFGQQGEAAQKNNELLRPIVEKVNNIINKIAADENYDFIFDSKAGVVFAKKSYDLTEKVIKSLNSGK
ncbi:MAG: OmpH family outer membrane protein [Chitinispirillales bacterium]|jgi:outer membrane protein|nr:OmpH family outer membrane protein [Chitinispirillales bacterium]